MRLTVGQVPNDSLICRDVPGRGYTNLASASRSPPLPGNLTSTLLSSYWVATGRQGWISWPTTSALRGPIYQVLHMDDAS